MNYRESPSYNDKEERRLITLSSMDNLLKFHEIERSEKYNTLKFYAVFLGGGLTLVFGMAKFSFGFKAALLELTAITVILLINFLAIKKLLSVRTASNNIYHEYGRRLRHLLNSHSSDLNEEEKETLDIAFQKYIDVQKKDNNLMTQLKEKMKDEEKNKKEIHTLKHKIFLPTHSADTYEIFVFSWMNIMFSLAYAIPLVEIYKYLDLLNPLIKTHEQLLVFYTGNTIALSFMSIQFLMILGTFFLSKYIVYKHIQSAPNLDIVTKNITKQRDCELSPKTP